MSARYRVQVSTAGKKQWRSVHSGVFTSHGGALQCSQGHPSSRIIVDRTGDGKWVPVAEPAAGSTQSPNGGSR